MAFDKKLHLKRNIDAIETAFRIEKERRTATPDEINLLQQFSGFGGLKFMLNPGDINQWQSSDIGYFPLTQELFAIIRANAGSESVYRQYVSSLKGSILDAFFTPAVISDGIATVIKDTGIKINRVLEPSAGVGAFIRPFSVNEDIQITAYEQDLITGKILKHLHGGQVDVRIEGFENISEHDGEYDLIVGNIPFGTTSIFDLSYSKGKNAARKFATHSIHNYFFLKAGDKLQEGGLLAFITTQGILNSPSNQIIREGLMREHRLVSALRLPHNLFDESGTSVGTDLIILQKDSGRRSLSQRAKDFMASVPTTAGENRNLLFYNPNNILFTSSREGTDHYGKPGTIYLHDGGAEGISTDLTKKLRADFASYFDHQLYGKHGSRQYIPEKLIGNSNPIATEEDPRQQLKRESLQLSLFSEAELTALIPEKQIKKRRSGKNTVQQSEQLSLFGNDGTNSDQIRQTRPLASKRDKKSPASNVIGRRESIGSLFRDLADDIPVPNEPNIFNKEIKTFYRDDTLVEFDQKIGKIKWNGKEGKFHFYPIAVSDKERERIAAYIRIRDCYHALYAFEANMQQEDHENRKLLNQLYDDFIRKFGNLNAADNIRFIKLDPAGNSVPSLERAVGAAVHKSDIFDHPVAFSTVEVNVNSPMEALSASLNQYGKVDLGYMCSISGLTANDLKEKLDGRLFYNPLAGELEVSQKFLSGNVVEKAKSVQEYILAHPDDQEAKVSLVALEAVRPEKINLNSLTLTSVSDG